MDELVKQAMVKWPTVPHCYGWLGLDARGAWRMRDERAQDLGLAGEKIVHPALLAFINRNYDVDERGCWYFQNGPQRVYVTLETAPYIAHTDPMHGFVLQTGQTLPPLTAVWLTETGQLLLQNEGTIAQLDDRDLASCMDNFRMDGIAITDAKLHAWLEGQSSAGQLTFVDQGRELPIQRMPAANIPCHFGFICAPQANA